MHKALVLATAVLATTSFADAWSPRATAFQAKAAAERKRLGLDPEKAKLQYPTPEVRFGAGAQWACPGQTITILLEGKLAPGTLVGSTSDAAEIVKEELTPKGWQGTIKVKPGTKDPILLQLIAPVSGINSTIELPVGCPHEWVIDLKEGDELVLKVVDTESRASGEWFRGGKSVDTRAFQLSTDGKTNFSLAQQETAEDRERVKAAQAPLNSKDSAARQQKLTAEMQACTALPPQQMGPCMQKHSAELQEMIAAQQGAVQNAQAAAAPKVGCVQLTGTIEGKKLKGTGMNCASKNPYDQQPFTGVIK
jgi:hypothetical protein